MISGNTVSKTCSSTEIIFEYFCNDYFGSPIPCNKCLHTQVDAESQRISLGMKKSYLGPSGEIPLDEKTRDSISTNVPNLEAQLRPSPETNCNEDEDLPLEFEILEPPAFKEVESRAFVPPLEVTLEDMELLDEDIMANANGSNVEDTNLKIVKDKKGSKKKAKEERFYFFTFIVPWSKQYMFMCFCIEIFFRIIFFLQGKGN